MLVVHFDLLKAIVVGVVLVTVVIILAAEFIDSRKRRKRK